MIDPTGFILESSEDYTKCTNTKLTSEIGCSEAINIYSHGQNVITGDLTKDGWLISQGFCRSKNGIGRWPVDYIFSSDEWDFSYRPSKIAENIENTYGINISKYGTNYQAIYNLAAIGHGFWLISKALENRIGGSGNSHIKKSFGHTKVEFGAGNIQSFLAMIEEINISLPFPFNIFSDGWSYKFRDGAAGVVPPKGLGGSGDTVFLKNSDDISNHNNFTEIFIHEIGHILDFTLGTNYVRGDLANNENPSTMLYDQTGGKYVGCGAIAYSANDPRWSLCVLLNDFYNEGGAPSNYGGMNHYEDFAETWTAWILLTASAYHSISYSSVDSLRLNFMNTSIADFIDRASNK